MRVEEALLGDVVRGAGQAREVDEEGRGLGGRRGGGQEDIEVHGGARRGGLVSELEELATERGDGCVGGEGHCDDAPGWGIESWVGWFGK